MAWASSNGMLSCACVSVCVHVNKAAFKPSLIHGCITAFRPALSACLFTAPSLCPTYSHAPTVSRLRGCADRPICGDKRPTLHSSASLPCTSSHTKLTEVNFSVYILAFSNFSAVLSHGHDTVHMTWNELHHRKQVFM